MAWSLVLLTRRLKKWPYVRKGVEMSKFIEVNLEECTVCRLCEFVCSTHHFSEIIGD